MPTIDDVAELFRDRIRRDSPDQFEKALDLWPDLPFNFFYLNHADDVVDIVVRAIAEDLAAQNGLTIPDFVFRNFEDQIEADTDVGVAIQLVFEALF